ncbi:MAG: hypothetical protein JWN66_1310 [Sphingomonas bacterium]|uniref:ATP-binding protein n=1 Tax=Sphingomonas bacterium TaxID=1895847 RepID=UPI002623AEF0|nr:ATP-binding protein [Sphingomonas bacterium]MDB5704194.1 hypothetical protein [Sphingomonas bacterium]
MRGDAKSKELAGRLYLLVAFGMALAIFSLDVLSPLQGAVAVLYTTVILVAARSHQRPLIAVAGILCCLLAILAYCLSHWGSPHEAPAMRLSVSLVAIAIATILSFRHQAAADQRARSDERYRAIFNAAGFPIWESDWSAAFAMMRDGADLDMHLVRGALRAASVNDANSAAAQLFGFAGQADFIGRGIFEHCTPAAETALARIYLALHRGDAAIEEEVRFTTAAGVDVDVVLRVTLPPEHHDWKRVLIMALDVTERNQAQERLSQSQAELMHVSRVTTLGQLAASIAHEVNQPLSAIITYATSGKRWLAREAPDAAEVSDCLDHIGLNGTRAAEVIGRIRALASNVGPTPGLIDVRRLLDETVAFLRRDLDASQVAVRVSCPTALPHVQGDRVQIQQVLINLMLNAQQAMTETPPEHRELCVEVAQDGHGVMVSVRDCGAGLLGDDHEHFFSPFVTTKPEGLGMGLSICRTIIEQHGGSLLASNNQDRGATFRFRLPVAETEGRAAA